MPEILKSHEIPVFVRHPWKEWADGQWRRFYQDQDFPHQSPENFYGSARKYAVRHNLSIKGRVRPNCVEFYMFPRETVSDQRDTTEQSAIE